MRSSLWKYQSSIFDTRFWSPCVLDRTRICHKRGVSGIERLLWRWHDIIFVFQSEREMHLQRLLFRHLLRTYWSVRFYSWVLFVLSTFESKLRQHLRKVMCQSTFSTWIAAVLFLRFDIDIWVVSRYVRLKFVVAHHQESSLWRI